MDMDIDIDIDIGSGTAQICGFAFCMPKTFANEQKTTTPPPGIMNHKLASCALYLNRKL